MPLTKHTESRQNTWKISMFLNRGNPVTRNKRKKMPRSPSSRPKIPKYFIQDQTHSPAALHGTSNEKSIQITIGYLAAANIDSQINVPETASTNSSDNVIFIGYYYVFSGYQHASEGSHFASLFKSFVTKFIDVPSHRVQA